MKHKIILLLALQQSAAIAQHTYWQENVAGTLLALHAPPAQPLCNPTVGMATYASRPLSGHTDFTRLQLSDCGFTFSGAHASAHLLHIIPAVVPPLQGAADDHVSHWGWRSNSNKSAYQLFWLDPRDAMLRSVQVAPEPLKWQPLWAAPVQNTVLSWLAADIAPQRLADDPTAEWLVLPGNAQVPVRLFQSQTGVPRQLSLPVVNGSFALLPLPADPDQDGLAERLYLLSTDGLLLQYDWQPVSGWQAAVAMDLRQSGWLFDGSLQRISARWPTATGWQQGDVFILQARDADNYRLLVLRRPAGVQRTFDLTDITDRVDLNKAGWQKLLAGRPVTHAKVLAGVLYLPLSSDPHMASPAYDQMLVTQVFSGADVYPQSLLTFADALQAPLRLAPDGNTFQLWSADQLILPQVQTLNPACLFCVEALEPRHLQGQQPLAMFRYEQVY